MKRVLALLLCVVLVIGVTACGKKEVKKTTPTTTAPATTATEQAKTYAHNEVINRFFVSYMERHNGKDIDTTSINRGKDLSEYTVNISECQVTIMDVSNKAYSSGRYALQVEIIGGTDTKALERMMNAFANIALAADADCTTDSTDNAVSMLTKMTKPFSTRTRISDRVYVAYYTPVVTDPVSQPCRMSLWILDDIVSATPLTTTSTTAN